MPSQPATLFEGSPESVAPDTSVGHACGHWYNAEMGTAVESAADEEVAEHEEGEEGEEDAEEAEDAAGREDGEDAAQPRPKPKLWIVNS